jgi:hypothetical protein
MKAKLRKVNMQHVTEGAEEINQFIGDFISILNADRIARTLQATVICNEIFTETLEKVSRLLTANDEA